MSEQYSEQPKDDQGSTPAIRYLQQHAIDFKLVNSNQTLISSHVVVVLLADAQYQLAVFLAQTSILDLRLINVQLEANLNWDEKATLGLKQALSCEKLPAIPELLQRQCIVDSQLANLEMVYLESGQQGTLLALTQSEFSRLLLAAQTLKVSQPIPANNPNLQPSSLEPDKNADGVYSLTSLRIKQTLVNTVKIPPLSNTAQKVLKLRTDPNASVEELTGIIETDPAMAAQVMSWAASPYYAAPSKVRSIEDAIIRVLGFDLVINLALGLALGKSLKLPSAQGQSNRDYWQSAIYTAALIEGLTLLVPRKHRPEVGLAYLCGLLHSFGYVLLAHLFPSYYQLTSQYLAANQHLPSYQVEFFLLGITREQIGAWLMQHWKMPPELIVALSQQHNPEYKGEHAIYAQLTLVARKLLTQQEAAESLQSVFADLGFDAAQAQQALEQVLAAEKALRSLASSFAN